MKFLKALLLATALSLASCSYMPSLAQITRSPQAVELRVQGPGETRDLGDGFQSRIVNSRDGQVLMIHFPVDGYMTEDEASIEPFRAAFKKGVVKQFGCEAFEKCAPKVDIVDKLLLIKAGSDMYEIHPLFDTADHSGPIVGVALIKFVKA